MANKYQFTANQGIHFPRYSPMEDKPNCWEFMKCGREPGGVNVERIGICPASTAIKYDAINNGTCAGRFCWPVAGTFCNGQIQGTFAAKIKDCLKCSFFLLVARQEEESLVFMKLGHTTPEDNI